MVSGPTLHPTHTCFDDALELIDQSVKANLIDPFDSSWHVVHALCYAPTGEVYAHGWVERDVSDGPNGDTGIVIFKAVFNGKGEYFTTLASEFYEQFEPFDVTRYDLASAATENVRHVHFGPWEDRYKAHCGNTKVWEPAPLGIMLEA